MKKIIFALLLLLASLCACAGALAAPELNAVFADDVSLISGQDGWFVQFEATEGGTIAMELYSGDTGEKLADLGACSIEAGAGSLAWNGLLPDGSAVPAGSYMVALQMKNFWGEESQQQVLSLHIYASEEEEEALRLDLSTLVAEEAIAWEDAQWEEETAEQVEGVDENGVPIATSFWDMNPDLYDLSDPAHQQAIWDLMMQPITVLDVGQTEHVYPTNQPGADRTPYEENCAGELHGQSQGVNVLEEDTDGDGYVLIESFSNDGTKTDNTYMESLDAKRIKGYVKESLLMTETPSDKYALLIDKLRQKLYVFEDGKIISEMYISTGLPNANQPYNETPAGEYITVSRVGNFYAGSNTIGRFAIRINGGTLLHEVLHDENADGTRNYSKYEPELGQKASHGCIRIPRRANAEGINMEWFWSNLELKTKVFIWDDVGRELYVPELPDENMQLYRNPDGGSNYHTDANCPGVRDQYLPLTGDFTYGDLELDEFKKLTPCVYCNAPKRLEELYELYRIEAEHIGAEIPQEILDMFGVTP